MPEIELKPRTLHSPAPLSPIQAEYIKYILKHSFSYRMSAAAVRIRGRLNVVALQRSLDAIVGRHESLRTRIVTAEGRCQQHIDSADHCDLSTVDLTHLPATAAWLEATSIAKAFAQQAVGIDVGPLFEAKLLRLSADEHALILVVDHLVADEISCAIIYRELWVLYGQADRGEPLCLPHLSIQFADYAVWQEQMHESWRQRHEAYWMERMAGIEATRIPQEAPAQLVEPTGSMLHFALGEAVTTQLRNLALSERTSLASVVLVIYTIVMSRWCNQDDMLMGFVSHARHRPALRGMVGPLANTLCLRLGIPAYDSFTNLLRQIAADYVTAAAHRDYAPYFVPECGIDVAFNWLQSDRAGAAASADGMREAGNGLRLQPFPASFVWPLTFASFFSDTAGGVGITVHYRPDRLRAATIKSFGRALSALTQQIVQSPNKRMPLAGVSMES